MNKSTADQLKEFNQRLQAPGFSWQHEDYFLLKEVVPELARCMKTLDDRGDNVGETVIMPKKLTAENGAKAMLMGEFAIVVPEYCPECRTFDKNAPMGIEDISEGCETCGGTGQILRNVNVPWTAIKAIYDKAVEHLSQPVVSSESIESKFSLVRDALAGLVGADQKEDLEKMEGVMRTTPVPEADRVTVLNAIHALIETAEA